MESDRDKVILETQNFTVELDYRSSEKVSTRARPLAGLIFLNTPDLAQIPFESLPGGVVRDAMLRQQSFRGHLSSLPTTGQYGTFGYQYRL